MLPPVLIPFILIAILALIAYLIFTIPLQLSLLIEHAGGSAVLMILAGWSIMCLKISSVNGKGSIELLFSGKSIYRKAIKPPAGAEIQEGAMNIRVAISLIQSIPDLWPGILRILKALKRHTRLQRLVCSLLLGTGSPATTGLIFGVFSAVRPFLMFSDRVSLSLEPVFDHEVLEGKCRLDMVLRYPLVIIALTLRLFISRRIWDRMKHIRPRKAEVTV